MAFDILSFIGGVAAGAVTGALAMVLHGLENTADLQEKVRNITREVEIVKSVMVSRSPEVKGNDSKTQIDELSRDLNEIHEQIRRMYKKGKN